MANRVDFENQTAAILPTTHLNKAGGFPFSLVVGGFIFGIIIMLGIVGNAMVVTALRKERKLQSRANYLIGSLAVADLLVSVIVSPFSAFVILRSSMIFKPEICHIFVILDVTCCTASILHLCVIAWVRYRKVSTVKNIYSRRFTAVLPTIVGIWIVAALLSIAPYFIFANTTQDEVDHVPGNVSVDLTGSILDLKNTTVVKKTDVDVRCTVNDNRIYRTVATILAFFGPLLVILIIYTRMAYIAFSRINPRRGIGNNFRYQTPCHSYHDSRRRLETFPRKNTGLVKTGRPISETTNEQALFKEITEPTRAEVRISVGYQKQHENNNGEFPQTKTKETSTSINDSIQDFTVAKGRIASASCTDIPRTNEQSFRQRQTFSCENLISQTIRSNCGNHRALKQKNGRTKHPDITCLSGNLALVEYDKLTNKTAGVYLSGEGEINSVIDRLTATEQDKADSYHLNKYAISSPKATRVLLNRNTTKSTFRYCRGQLSKQLPATTFTHCNMQDNKSCKIESTRLKEDLPSIEYLNALQRNSSFISAKIKKERKVIRTLGMIIGVFVLCWLPFFAKEVILPFCKETCYLSQETEIFINWLGYANSALNPFIYAYSNKDFGNAFRRIFARITEFIQK